MRSPINEVLMVSYAGQSTHCYGGKMNKIILLLISILLLFLSFSYASRAQLNKGLKIPEYPVSKQSKAVFEKDINLKNSVFKFLYYDSCDSSKARDYKGMYTMLSRSYLKNFPNVKTAIEYENYMESHDEIYHLVYLMVENVEYTQKDRVKIKVKFESGNEGVLQIMEEEIFFKIENGLWKYDGSAVGSLKVIETLE
jgi:hypothetical protein